MNYKTYEFELNLSNIPNFDIYTSSEISDISDEYLNNYSNYLKQIISTLDKDRIVILTIYGGEPFTKIDKLKIFIEQLIGHVDHFCISTYGGGILENWPSILNLWNKLSNTFSIKLHWSDQNNDLFWKIFTKLFSRHLVSGFSTRISSSNIEKLPFLINNFIDNVYTTQRTTLRRLNLFVSFNKSEYSNFDKGEIEKILQESVDIINSSDIITNDDIVYYNKLNYLGDTNKILLDCMTIDGSIYVGCDTPVMSDYGLTNCKVGHISENIDTLLEKRNNFKLNNSIDLTTLDDYHKLFLSTPKIEFSDTGIDKINEQPFTEAYELHELFQKYFNK